MSDSVKVLMATRGENGQFTSSPFDDQPPWLIDAMKYGRMALVPYEYGVWAVKIGFEDNMKIVIAEPGDTISRSTMFGVHVEKAKTNKMTWDQFDTSKDSTNDGD